MTKHEFLEKLINKKDTWQVTMPIFKEQNETIVIHKGISYQGAFQIILDGDVLFECLVESLKGLVKPINEFVSMKSPVIEYIIDPTLLKMDYIYEDRLICYYPGGSTEVDIRFTVIKEEVKEILVEPKTKKTISKVNKTNDEVTLQLSKKTYGMDEVIHLNITNQSNRPKHLVFECHQDYVSPNLTEVFLNNKWTQEWYLKKTIIERLFGKFSFSNEPFKEIIIEGFIDHASIPSCHINASVTVYEAYEAVNIITNNQMFNRTKISVFRHYIEGLVNPASKRETLNSLDLIKSCLNFNQQDLDLRLFYIWLLLEFGHKKEAKIEMNLVEKYGDYYSSMKEYPLIKILSSIINKKTATMSEIFKDVDETSTWLELLAKARFTASRNNRYSYYKTLFNSGLRKSFLFGEVTSLLNQLPIIPEEDDELYVVTLKWAFNKNGVSSSWLSKLERHYYQLEKNPYMTSALAKELHKLKNTKNFLRLFCQLCIREKRYDNLAYEGFNEALNSKIYIQDIESHYIQAAWQVKTEIDLELIKHFTKVQQLDDPVREYTYLSIVKKRATYGLLYRRLYNEIINYLKEVNHISVELIQLMTYMFEEFVKEKNKILFEVISDQSLNRIKEYKEGLILIHKFFEFAMNESCWIEPSLKEGFIKGIIRSIGFEGLSYIYNDKSIVMNYFDQLNSNGQMSSSFIDNELYIARHESRDRLSNLYKQIIIDDFIEGLINGYLELNSSQKESIKDLFFYYIGRRIVVGFESVTDVFLEEMYDYYISSQSKPAWLLLALSRGLNSSNTDLTKRIRNLYEEGQKHGIIVPWFSEDVFEGNAKTIHYLSHPEDSVMIFYRFNENKEFKSVNMKHIAFGVFMHRIKLFYGEYFDYYIIIKDKNGEEYLPHSDLIMNDTIAQNSLFIENEYSVEARIDNVTLSYELNDDLSAKVFIDEQLEFNQRMQRLLKV